MSSPAPTAYALMQTGDRKCFQFLEGIVNNFKEGGKINVLWNPYRKITIT
jgi:hypothetical protein